MSLSACLPDRRDTMNKWLACGERKLRCDLLGRRLGETWGALLGMSNRIRRDDRGRQSLHDRGGQTDLSLCTARFQLLRERVDNLSRSLRRKPQVERYDVVMSVRSTIGQPEELRHFR